MQSGGLSLAVAMEDCGDGDTCALAKAKGPYTSDLSSGFIQGAPDRYVGHGAGYSEVVQRPPKKWPMYSLLLATLTLFALLVYLAFARTPPTASPPTGVPLLSTRAGREQQVRDLKALSNSSAHRRKLSAGPKECQCLPLPEAQQCNPGTADLVAEASKDDSLCLKQEDTEYLWCYISAQCNQAFGRQSTAGSSCKWKLASWFDCIEGNPARASNIPTEQKAATAQCAFDVLGIVNNFAAVGLTLEEVTKPAAGIIESDYELAQQIVDVIAAFSGATTGLIAAVNNCRLGLPPVVSSLCALDIIDMVTDALNVASIGMSIEVDCAHHEHGANHAYIQPNLSASNDYNKTFYIPQHKTPAEIWQIMQEGESREKAYNQANCAFGASGVAQTLGNMGIRVSTMAEDCAQQENPDHQYTCAMQIVGLLNDLAAVAGSISGMIADCPIKDINGDQPECAADISGLVAATLTFALGADACRTDCVPGEMEAQVPLDQIQVEPPVST